MKKTAAIIVFLFLQMLTFSQTYNGINTSKKYSCCLKINPDSSVVFIYNTLSNETFAQYAGTIKQLKDSLFTVSATITLGKFDIMWLPLINRETGKTDDTYYFCIDSVHLKMLDNVQIKYQNGQTENYSGQNNFILNKKLYHKTGDYFMINTGATNGITGAKLQFKVRYGSFPTFENGDKITFNIIIKGNVIKSDGKPVLQTGHFRMVKRFAE